LISTVTGIIVGFGSIFAAIFQQLIPFFVSHIFFVFFCKKNDGFSKNYNYKCLGLSLGAAISLVPMARKEYKKIRTQSQLQKSLLFELEPIV